MDKSGNSNGVKLMCDLVIDITNVYLCNELTRGYLVPLLFCMSVGYSKPSGNTQIPF